MPNFNEVARKEEIVLANIDRTIGRFQARKELSECEIVGQASAVVITLLEATRCEVVIAAEGLVSIQRNVSKVINRAIEQFKFREEIATCKVEEGIYKDTRNSLNIILNDYVRPKQAFPKMWPVCGVVTI